MTVRDWLQSAASRLSAAGVESALLEAQLLAAHVLLVERVWLLTHPEEPFPDLAGESLLARRLNSEPLPYILGRREFYGRRFAVGPGVLIPRQDTEVLVEFALDWLRIQRNPNVSVLDLGTGSGCVAITLKLEDPTLRVTASDISAEALEIAARNAADLRADVRFVESDAFQGLGDEVFDLIVTNPPYIGRSEVLDRQVSAFEPAVALYAGETGYEFYDRLAHEARNHLKPHGCLFAEVGYTQSDGVSERLRQNGWSGVVQKNDLAGIARVIRAQL